MFQHPGPKLSVTISSAIVEMQPQIFPSWKTGTLTQKPTRFITICINIIHDKLIITTNSAPGTKTVRNGHVTPRPFWSNVIKTKQPHVVRSLIKSKAIKLPQI